MYFSPSFMSSQAADLYRPEAHQNSSMAAYSVAASMITAQSHASAPRHSNDKQRLSALVSAGLTPKDAMTVIVSINEGTNLVVQGLSAQDWLDSINVNED